MKYCESIYRTTRRKTREVLIGNIGVGGNNPIRIQSMTTSSTRDIAATVDQIIKLADHGCEIVRLTVQGMKEAEACEHIKNILIQKKYETPLVADIHFYPPAAMHVLDFVDKVRINPGNYVDKRASFKIIEYSDKAYLEELQKIDEKFSPLVLKAKKLKKVLRIGTNHGSLSDRIMNRYGDTPDGMVESAMEFAKICRAHDFHDFVFSMKASNPFIMIKAYRLLCAKMYDLGWDYPLHLGVTEAGEGEDGRIKSAIGIGSLLLDGLGDTIRVSLTEDPWHEIESCKKLIQLYESYENKGIDPFKESFRDIQDIKRRELIYPKTISMHQAGTVYLHADHSQIADPQFISKIGLEENKEGIKIKIDSADGVITSGQILPHLAEKGVTFFAKNPLSKLAKNMFNLSKLIKEKQNLFMTSAYQSTNYQEEFTLEVTSAKVEEWEYIKTFRPSLIFFQPCNQEKIHIVRKFINWLQGEKLKIPVIFNFMYEGSEEDLIIRSSAEIGSLLCDGLGEGVAISHQEASLEKIRSYSFGILQGCRMRTIKTEFISCPSCGRTLFDLQEVTKRIKKRTGHLAGVKIGIMGCIVNGPGEMADADFGYVGSGVGKVDLYIGKKRVEKDIDFSVADDRLIELIKSENKWVEPVTV